MDPEINFYCHFIALEISLLGTEQTYPFLLSSLHVHLCMHTPHSLNHRVTLLTVIQNSDLSLAFPTCAKIAQWGLETPSHIKWHPGPVSFASCVSSLTGVNPYKSNDCNANLSVYPWKPDLVLIHVKNIFPSFLFWQIPFGCCTSLILNKIAEVNCSICVDGTYSLYFC